jgi:hypothetical protein
MHGCAKFVEKTAMFITAYADSRGGRFGTSQSISLALFSAIAGPRCFHSTITLYLKGSTRSLDNYFRSQVCGSPSTKFRTARKRTRHSEQLKR